MEVTIYTVLLTVVLFNGIEALCSFDGKWHHFDGYCFYLSPENIFRDYNTSVEGCYILGARLVSVDNKKQTDFIVDNLFNCTSESCRSNDANDQFWIGLRKSDTGLSSETNATIRRRGWTWVGKAWYEWTNWYGEEPDNNEEYARMFRNGQWAGTDGEQQFRYVCEIEDNTVKSSHASAGTTRSSGSTRASTTTKNIPTRYKNSDRTSAPSTSYTTQSGLGAPDESKETSMFLYIGPALGVVLLIVIGVVIFIVCRRRRAKTKANNVYYNTRDNLNNRPPKEINLHNDSGNQNTYDTQLPPGHNLPPDPIGPMYAEIDKGGQRNSMQGPPTANKPVDNGRISAMYAQPDLTAKKNRRNVNTAPDEDVTLVENSTYATTLPK